MNAWRRQSETYDMSLVRETSNKKNRKITEQQTVCRILQKNVLYNVNIIQKAVT